MERRPVTIPFLLPEAENRHRRSSSRPAVLFRPSTLPTWSCEYRLLALRAR
jgi:hypothetical protein